MITLSRPVRSGDTSGSVLTVKLPESTVHASRDGGSWVVTVTDTQAHRLRSQSKHWRVTVASTPQVEAAGVEPASFSVLSGTVSELELELEAGNHDDHLDALLEAEVEGKNRSTAIRAITDRMDEVQ